MVQKFLPHDNGSRPFAVYIDKNKVIVYKQKFDFEKNKYIQNAKPSLQFTFLKAFTGKRSKFAKSPQYSFQKGNSLLFKINATQYLYVGESIFTFKLQKGDKIIYYDYLYESTINNNRTNNPQKYDSVSPWSSNITYTPTSLAEYSNRIYVYSGLGSTASINPPVLDQGDNANWLDITEWSKINYEPIQTIDEYRRITTTYSIGVTQSTTLLNQIPPYNFTIDSNLDPFITIEITSDNGYGSIYNDKKNYEIRGIKDLTDKVVPIEQIGPFVPITII